MKWVCDILSHPKTAYYGRTNGFTVCKLDRSATNPDYSLVKIPIWDYSLTMKIVSVNTLRLFWEKFPDAAQHLMAWVDETRKASWTQPVDIKAQYRNASILKNRRVVFNIKGNDYRLVVSIAYKFGAVYIKFIGTHKQYDAINAETINPE